MSMRRALGAPTRGAGTALAVTEGSPVFGLLPLYKRQANVQTTSVIPKPVTDVTGRGNPFLFQIAVCFWAAQRRTDSHVASLNATAAYLDSLICRLVPLGAMTGWFWTCASIYTLVQGAALRDGTVAVPYGRVFGALFLFSPARVATLATPSALTRHCLAAARSRRGSDMPPACHSLPRRRCTTLGGAALRGKDFGFCADLGSAPRQRFRTGAWRRGAPLAPLLGELARRQP